MQTYQIYFIPSNIFNVFFKIFLMEDSIFFRLNQFIDYLGISNNKFAESCGLSAAQMSNMLNGRNFGIDKLLNIFNKYSYLNSEWLIKGEGSMLKGEIMEPPETKHIVQLDKMVGGSSNEAERIYKELLKEKELKIDELKEKIWRLEEKVKTLENKHHKPSLPNVYTTQQPQLIENKDIINEDCK